MLSLAKHVGVSSLVQGSTDLDTIEQFVRSYPLPQEFAYQIMVHHTLAKFFSTVVENSQEEMSYSLVKIIDAELDSLRAKYPTPWTARAETANLTAKILLYTTVIIRLRSDRSTRDILMRNGLYTAVRLIYLIDQGLAFESKEYPNVPPEALQRTLPKNYFRVLVLATTFLLRFFVLNIHATPDEQELARNYVAISRQFLAAGAMGPDDERMRGAKLFERLSRQQPVDLAKSKLRVDDRMGASLYYDAVATGHALRNESTEIEKSAPKESKGSASGKPQGPLAQFPDISTESSHPFSDMDIAGYETLDFTMPEGLWGDSIWGMMANIAPAGYATYGPPGNIQNQLALPDTYNQAGANGF